MGIAEQDIRRARDWPIVEIWERLGLPSVSNGKMALAPWRSESQGSVQVGGSINIVTDYGSGESLDTIGLVRKVQQMDFPEAVRWILGGITEAPRATAARAERDTGRASNKWTPEQARKYLGAALGDEALALLRGYGLTDETIAAAPLAQYSTSRGASILYADSLDAPTVIKGKSIKRNDLGKRFSFFKLGKPGLWWPKGVGTPGQALHLTGGEEKALLLGQEFGTAVVASTLAGEGPKKLTDALAAEIAATEPGRVTIWLDADETGREGAEDWAEQLAAAGVANVWIVDWPEDVARGYDVNDAYRDGGRELLQQQWQQARQAGRPWRMGAALARDGRVVVAMSDRSAEAAYGAGAAVAMADRDDLLEAMEGRTATVVVDYAGGDRGEALAADGAAVARRLYLAGVSTAVVEIRGGAGDADLATLIADGETVERVMAWGEPYGRWYVARLAETRDEDARKGELREFLEAARRTWPWADVAEIVDEAKRLKTWPSAWLREVAAQVKRRRPSLPDGRPAVVGPGEGRLYSAVIAAIVEPVRQTLPWYERGRTIVEPVEGRVVEVTPTAAQSEIETAVTFITPDGVPKPLRRDDAAVILSAPAMLEALPRLKRVAMAPLPYYRDEGGERHVAFLRPGYNAECETFLEWDGPLPKLMSLEDARETLDDYLADFCFQDDGATARAVSQANAVAAMMTLMARGLYDGLTPAFQIEGNQPGIGKGELVKAITAPILGDEPGAMAWAGDEDEMRKRLFSIAAEGGPVAWLDDLDGHIKSSALNMALTSRIYRDRELGRSEMRAYPWESVVMMTGNHYTIERDMARRIVPIMLHYSGENIDAREYRHKHLMAYARTMRLRLLGALATFITHWDAEGRPMAEIPFASYTEWSETVGGICLAAGYEHVLENRRAAAAAHDDEHQMMAALLERMDSTVKLEWRTDDVLEVMKELEVFPWIWEKSSRGAACSIGRLFKRWSGRVLDGRMLSITRKLPARYDVIHI